MVARTGSSSWATSGDPSFPAVRTGIQPSPPWPGRSQPGVARRWSWASPISRSAEPISPGRSVQLSSVVTTTVLPSSQVTWISASSSG